MRSLAVLVSLLSVLGLGFTLPFRQMCPKVDPVKNLDLQRFKGPWYEILRINTTGNVSTKCHAEAYLPTEGNLIEILSETTNLESGAVQYLNGIGIIEAENPNVWRYNFPSVMAGGEMYVTSTDYDNYAFLYTCKTIEAYMDVYGWLVSRTRKMSDDVLKAILKELKLYNVDANTLVYIDQTNCSALHINSNGTARAEANKPAAANSTTTE